MARAKFWTEKDNSSISMAPTIMDIFTSTALINVDYTFIPIKTTIMEHGKLTKPMVSASLAIMKEYSAEGSGLMTFSTA